MTTDQSKFQVNAIGIVRSALKNLEDCPLQGDEGAPEASIEILPEYAAGLEGLAPGNELIILTWFHQSDRSVIKTYPRNFKDAPPVGVFSTRSPARPNPIGLHRVKVVEINGNNVKVIPLEALDGTPVVDIKPVFRDN